MKDDRWGILYWGTASTDTAMPRHPLTGSVSTPKCSSSYIPLQNRKSASNHPSLKSSTAFCNNAPTLIILSPVDDSCRGEWRSPRGRLRAIIFCFGKNGKSGKTDTFNHYGLSCHFCHFCHFCHVIFFLHPPSLPLGVPENFNFWGERRHKLPVY